MRLVVLAKACVPGRVKTRLTPPLTPVEGAALAEVSLRQTLDTARQVRGVDRVLLLDGDPAGLDTSGFLVVPQVAGGLDERIAAALDDAAPSPLLLIGMDTPQVTAGQLQRVVDDTEADAWFGPAVDGGFWAIGLRRPTGDLVRGVPMSRSDTGRIQLARLHDAGLRIRQLETLVDMDRMEDATTIAATVPGTPFARAAEALERTVRDREPEVRA